MRAGALFLTRRRGPRQASGDWRAGAPRGGARCLILGGNGNGHGRCPAAGLCRSQPRKGTMVRPARCVAGDAPRGGEAARGTPEAGALRGGGRGPGLAGGGGAAAGG